MYTTTFVICSLFLSFITSMCAIETDGYILAPSDKLRFLDSLNYYRAKIGAPVLRYSFQEDSLARLRVATIYRNLDSLHKASIKYDYMEALHFRFDEDILSYDKKNVHPDTVLAWQGECSAHLSRFKTSSDWTMDLFNGWKNSPAHWEMLMESKFEYAVLHLYSDTDRYFKYRLGSVASLILFSKAINKKSLRSNSAD